MAKNESEMARNGQVVSRQAPKNRSQNEFPSSLSQVLVTIRTAMPTLSISAQLL